MSGVVVFADSVDDLAVSVQILGILIHVTGRMDPLSAIHAVDLDSSRLSTRLLRRNVKIIWEWSAKQCYQIIKDNGFRLPVDYEMWGRSFDGIGYQWLKPLRERFPNDYQKIVDWFPLIELEFFRFEQLENKPEAWK